MTPFRRGSAPKRKKSDAGSPILGEPEFVLVGIVRRPHGITGEVLVDPQTHFPQSLQKGVRLYLGEDLRPITVSSRRDHKGILLAFDEFNSPEDWGNARNLPLYKRTQDSPKLPGGTFFYHQLLGINVLSEEDESIGTLSEIIETGANDVFVISDIKGGEILVPSVGEFIREVNLLKNCMIVRLLPGMRE